MAEVEKDDLRGDIANAMKEIAGDTIERPETQQDSPEAQPQETAEARAERVRDEQGRFAAKAKDDKPRETLTLKDKPTGTPSEAGKAPDSAAAPLAPTAIDPNKPEPIAPPMEWKGAGKVKWDRLPREVQSELRDTWQAMATERAEVAPLKEMLDANRQTLVREAGSVQEGVRQLLAFHQLSLEKPLDLIQHIARSRGIDLRAAFQGQPVQGTPSQPDLTSLIEQAVQQRIEPIVGQFQQQQTNQVLSQIEAFRADPAHPYFNDVAPQIELLLKAGAAQGLQDAYDQAIWANPTIRQQLMSAQAEEAKKAQAAEVEKARRAQAASLRGSPLPGALANGAGNQTSTVADDVRAAAAELAGA